MVLVAPGDPDPPELDAVRSLVAVDVARDEDGVRARLDASILCSYDFRTDVVHALGPDAASFDWIHAASAGVDAVLTPAVRDAEVLVTNARGVFDRPIAEYVLGLLLAFCKDLPATLEHQRAATWRHRETRPFAGRHVLVVGAGSIGATIGRLCAAVEAEVRGVASRARHDPDLGPLATPDDLPELLGWADDVVVAVPLTDATRGLFDDAAFAALRPGATFVNIGRGPVVDEAALLAALDRGQVSAAGLDVFHEEPLPPDHPFWARPDVVVSPHMSGDEVGWEAALTRQFVTNLERWIAGLVPEHVVHGRIPEERP